jgi:hypothetical protein
MSKYRTEVFCSFSFEALHCWAKCPIDEVSYLRDMHRHMFYVKAFVEVNHDDRDVEFIQLKHNMQAYLMQKYPHDQLSPFPVLVLQSMSCEMLAQDLLERFNLVRCEVNEDNENGAIVYNTIK